MSLHLYNTLTRKKEEFKPLNDGRVGMYVCGPTVYGDAHLGHAKSYISFDILCRYLRYLGYSVVYVQNITDVGHLTDDADSGDDKLAVQAAKERKHPMAIAEYYTANYFRDMDLVGCVRPDISPRATGHIPEQIELIEKLLEKGFAYEVNGSVYFDVSKMKDYGKLSGRNIEDMISGTRIEVSSEKKAAVDFALWKKADSGHIMKWKSPWSVGYPGWHLECSAMSMKYLGETIDIHGGGLENQFPHHECEIAQSQCATGKQFVRYWVHNNMVTVDGQKMGKSLNNFITLSEVFSGQHERLSRGYDPLAARQLVLNSHYRSPLDFSDAALTAAQSGYDKITKAVTALRKKVGSAGSGPIDEKIQAKLKEITDKFQKAMDDDLNTAVALSMIFELVKVANSLTDNQSSATLEAILEKFKNLGGDVLGIVKDKYDTCSDGDDQLLDHLIGLLIDQRAEARANKDYEKSDAIRDKLLSFGILLEDKPGQQCSWRRK